MTHANETHPVTSIVFAAGKGSRMRGYSGNKTLLPLISSAANPYEGDRPLLVEVLENLPPGPKGIVVHHRAEDVQEATAAYSCTYCFQPETNGTGGALLAALPFLESVGTEEVIITMGDVPLIRPETYRRLLRSLGQRHLAVLAFDPRDPAQYGKLEVEGDRVLRIVEWKYWHGEQDPERRARLNLCNAGVYGARRRPLLECLRELEKNPHVVEKERDGRWVQIREYFLTDLVEIMNRAGYSVGLCLADEEEVLGVDTPEALKRAQSIYAQRRASS
ncbi:MobA-like NTP transferase domain-containing protein [Desulfacinum hydrothermale DSM 13146]|uniref:MobA-like NTP transferase domain-containing protein n=1 Tax=Desulfacinum hydrothermale DSM 13146 TaxID=1121390 RepID=A0A1W1X5C9_9BACT|nr:NTP transferase domain-containing protein [Desulfacinum hydrothermale]SMC19115.1 MobA-like NTP transferase domain-containing protein [Desulfacinum hydrothermale DSM 13146]